jgi:NitT/TauT family transport system permease protein
MKRTVLKNVIQAALATAFLLFCYLLSYWIVGNELLIPAPIDTLKSMGELLVGAGFWVGLGSTLIRVLIAFICAFTLAVVFAVISYMYPFFEGIFMPIVSALRSLPVLAVLLILISLFGAGEAPIAVAFLSLFPMLYAGVLAALSGVDRHLVDVSRVCGTSVWRRVTAIYLPLSAPYVLKEGAAALSFALKLTVSAEVLANTVKSLGGMMQDAKVYAEIPQLFALVAVTFLLGLVLETALGLLASAAQKRLR